MTMTDRLPDSLVSEKRFSRFLIVGLAGFLIDQTVLTALIEVASAPLEVAKLASAETAIIVMFFVNDRWTFADWGEDSHRSVGSRLVRSNLVRIGGILVATAVLSVLVRVAGMPYLAANAVGIGCGFVVNYTFETLFTWRVGR